GGIRVPHEPPGFIDDHESRPHGVRRPAPDPVEDQEHRCGALLLWETREHVRNISALAVGGFAAPEEPRSRPVHVPLEPATDAVHSPMSAEVKLNVRETRRDKAG